MLSRLYIIYILVHGVSGAHKWDWNLLIESDEPPRDVVAGAQCLDDEFLSSASMDLTTQC